MNLFDFFRANKKPSTASVAKERLQIIVAHERGQRSTPDYLPALQKELVEVIRKYVNIGSDDVHVALESQGSCSILELNITLPDRCVDPAGATAVQAVCTLWEQCLLPQSGGPEPPLAFVTRLF
jgi:cell division topological specificity factor